jgi:lipopolysaccharide transport system ATP-binding protein
VKNEKGTVVDTIRSVEPCVVEVEYELQAPITGLRIGIYLLSTRGEYIFTSLIPTKPAALSS